MKDSCAKVGKLHFSETLKPQSKLVFFTYVRKKVRYSIKKEKKNL